MVTTSLDGQVCTYNDHMLVAINTPIPVYAHTDVCICMQYVTLVLMFIYMYMNVYVGYVG